MRLSGPGITPTQSQGITDAQAATVPGGRLFVPAAYYQTTGSQNTTLDAANDLVSFSWIQECDMALSSLSVHVGAVTTQGNINLDLYTDSAGGPGALLYSIGTVDCGAAAGWVRRTLAVAQQLSRGTRYHIVFTGTASASFGLSSRRNNATVASGFPAVAISRTNLNGAGSWTRLTQDGLDANLNVILNSTVTTHAPQLYYGQFNGPYTNLPGSGLVDIPSAGLGYSCAALTAATQYYVYAYDNSGTLAIEASATVPVVDSGRWVKTGATSRLLIGLIYPGNTVSTAVGPIDCADYRCVANVYNQIGRYIGKPEINNGVYYTAIADTNWNTLEPGSQSWYVWAMTWNSLVSLDASVMANPGTGNQIICAIGDNAISPAAGTGWGGRVSFSPIGITYVNRVDNGLHYFVPLFKSHIISGYVYYVDYAKCSYFSGVIWS